MFALNAAFQKVNNVGWKVKFSCTELYFISETLMKMLYILDRKWHGSTLDL